jgi:ribosome modulation factor
MQDATATLTNLPSPDVLANWMREYRTQRRKCDEENGVLRNIVKRAKADGVNTKSMIAAVAATKQDPDQVSADTRDTIYYMSVLRIPVSEEAVFSGWQASVTERTRAQDDEWDAQDKGYRAGQAGVPIEDCPYPPGTELHQQWSQFWNRGQAALARTLGPNETQAPTTRERPTRKTAAAKPPRKAKAAKPPRPRGNGRSRRLADATHDDA